MSASRVFSSPATAMATRQFAIAALCAASSAASVHADFFVINGDNVARYNDSGSLINGAFVTSVQPTGLAVGADYSLYVGTATDFSLGTSIRRYDLGTGAALGAFTSLTADSSLSNPQAMAFGSDGRLYVAEAGGGSILAYGPSGGVHAQSYSDFSVANAPWGLVFDAAKTTAYIADRGGFYLGKLDTGTGTLSTVNSTLGSFTTLNDVALDGSGFAYGVSGGGIFKINLSDGSNSKIVDSVAANFSFDEAHITSGPGGLLYVTGIDGTDNHSAVQTFQTDGTPGGRFIDLGFATGPGPMTIVYTTVPEPAAWGAWTASALASLAIARRRSNASRSR